MAACMCWVPQIGRPGTTGGETACHFGRTAIPKHSGSGLVGRISLSGLLVLFLGGHRDGDGLSWRPGARLTPRGWRLIPSMSARGLHPATGRRTPPTYHGCAYGRPGQVSGLTGNSNVATGRTAAGNDSTRPRPARVAHVAAERRVGEVHLAFSNLVYLHTYLEIESSATDDIVRDRRCVCRDHSKVAGLRRDTSQSKPSIRKQSYCGRHLPTSTHSLRTRMGR